MVVIWGAKKIQNWFQHNMTFSFNLFNLDFKNIWITMQMCSFIFIQDLFVVSNCTFSYIIKVWCYFFWTPHEGTHARINQTYSFHLINWIVEQKTVLTKKNYFTFFELIDWLNKICWKVHVLSHYNFSSLKLKKNRRTYIYKKIEQLWLEFCIGFSSTRVTK